ncbi:MAG: RibD family protein [Chloroflexi bacterium]|nr:RibD family protein [Chloroflexota bacterium]
MLPYIILHNTVSIDGRIDWFAPDIGLFYELTSFWKEDATLAGSDTLLKAYSGEPAPGTVGETPIPLQKKADDPRPLLVVPDTRGRLQRFGHLLQKEPYWRDIVVLCSDTTSKDYLSYLKKRHIGYIVSGNDHADLKQALEELNASYGVKVVRVDRGGTLNGVLLRAGLVNEVSILVHPCLVGGVTPQSIFRSADLTSAEDVVHLKLSHIEKLRDDIVWLRYQVLR